MMMSSMHVRTLDSYAIVGPPTHKHWNVAGALQSPKGMTLNSKDPLGYCIEGSFSWSSGATSTYQ